jgi:iron complex outermembrane receptor protein
MTFLCRIRPTVSPVAIATALLWSASAWATAPADPPEPTDVPAADVPAADDQQGSDVVVTGSRSAPRTVAESPAPIDVLPAEAITRANKSNLLETLNTLLPSFNLPNVSNPNVASMVRAGQLRGLNPDQTLVLVNGKRRHVTAFLGAGGFSASAPADLSLIPTGAVSRIEVLRDGASAIYGSDAIAGVINIITDDLAEGGSVSARVGRFYEGDGLTRQFKADVGVRLGEGGYLHLAGQIDTQKIVIRNSPIPSTFLFYFPTNAAGRQILPAGNLSSSPTLPAGATPNPREATRNNNAWINQGHAPFRLEAVSASAGTKLGEGAELYGFGSYAHRTSHAPQNFRQPVRDEVVRAIYPDGFTPVEAIRENDYSITAGVRGDDLAGWHWDLSTTYGRDKIDIFVRNSINPTYGLASQTDFYIGRVTYADWVNNLDLRRSYEDLLPFPIDVSFGGEYREERQTVGAGDRQSYTSGGVGVLDGPNAGKALGASLGGSQALPGFRPADASDAQRTNVSVYGGVALHPTEALLIDLAGRLEHFSDFGKTATGRISARYDFGGGFALRGTVSNGFHAPSLAAQSYKNTSNMNTSVNHVLQVNSAEARALGSQPLRPEKSTNYSIGAVWAQPGLFTLAIDLYQIDVRDRIAQSTTFRDGLYPGSGALVAAAGFGRDDGVSYFINAADSRTRGIEATLEGAFGLGDYGRLRWSLAGNLNDTDVTNIAATPAVLARFNIPVFSRASQNALRFLSPRHKEILTLNWTRSILSVQVRETHYGAIDRFGTPAVVATTGPYAGQAEIPYSIGGLWVTDLDIGVDVTDRLTLSGQINNLFSVKPSKLPAPLLSAWQTYSYANNGPISAAGGFWSVTARYRF